MIADKLTPGAAAAALAIAAVAVAGCGSSSSSGGAAGGSAKAASIASITTKHGKLGTILAVGAKRLTVYLFEADKGATSTCSGTCAQVWPPVLGKASAAGGAIGADLGTTKRSNGSVQVTYKGHPLYTYARDRDDGDAYGQGIKLFGAAWYVLKPSGEKLDRS